MPIPVPPPTPGQYFGTSYWPLRYWGRGGSAPPESGIYWSSTFFGSKFFGARYWPGAAPTPSETLDFRRAVVATLQASTDLATLVGTKIFPIRVPEDKSTPAVLYQIQSLPRVHHLDGPAGLPEASVRVAAGSVKFADTVSAATTLRNLFDGFKGTLTGNVVVLETILEDEQDLYDPPIDKSDRGTFWTVLTFKFRYRESHTI